MADPTLPAGYLFVIDAAGNQLVDADGNWLIAPDPAVTGGTGTVWSGSGTVSPNVSLQGTGTVATTGVTRFGAGKVNAILTVSGNGQKVVTSSGTIPVGVSLRGTIKKNPRVLSASAINEKTIRVIFDAAMSPDSLLRSVSNYAITAVASSGSVAVIVRTLSLPSGIAYPTFVDLGVTAMTNGSSYKITINSSLNAPLDQFGLPVSPAFNFTTFTGFGVNPKVSYVKSVSKNRVDVKFTSAMLLEPSIQDKTKYTWSGGLSTVSVLGLVSDTVQLVTSDQTPGQLYNLTINSDFPGIDTTSYQTIFGGLYVDMWRADQGVAAVSGVVTSWISLGGRTASPPGTGPNYAADGSNFLSKPVVQCSAASNKRLVASLSSSLPNSGGKPWVMSVFRFRSAPATDGTYGIFDLGGTSTYHYTIWRKIGSSTNGFNFLINNSNEIFGPTGNTFPHNTQGWADTVNNLTVDGINYSSGSGTTISQPITSIGIGCLSFAGNIQVSDTSHAMHIICSSKPSALQIAAAKAKSVVDWGV